MCCESHGKIHQAFSLFLHTASDQKLQFTTLIILQVTKSGEVGWWGGGEVEEATDG